MATFLYRNDCLQGRIFNTQAEVEQATRDGWVDAPGKAAEAGAAPPAAESVVDEPPIDESVAYERPAFTTKKKGK